MYIFDVSGFSPEGFAQLPFLSFSLFKEKKYIKINKNNKAKSWPSAQLLKAASSIAARKVKNIPTQTPTDVYRLMYWRYTWFDMTPKPCYVIT